MSARSLDVYTYRSYKAYLNERLDDESRGGGHGARAKLSREVGCQTAYTAQVLRGEAHFSLEQSENINQFFGHTEEEGHYFLLLVQEARAGTQNLKQRFEKQLQAIRDNRLVLKNRIDVKQALGESHAQIYYSSWLYGAAHALISIPRINTPEALAGELNVSLRRASELIEFLRECGLVTKQKGRLAIGNARIHLPHDSPLIAKHHINWRLRAIQDMESATPYRNQLHYSSVVSISGNDTQKVHEILVKAIEEIKRIVRDSRKKKYEVLV